jgi:hypothetical protein
VEKPHREKNVPRGTAARKVKVFVELTSLVEPEIESEMTSKIKDYERPKPVFATALSFRFIPPKRSRIGLFAAAAPLYMILGRSRPDVLRGEK